jgi:SSS family solute:Na+ symporter
MFGLTRADWIFIAVYSGLMVALGLAAMRRVKNQEDFFLGGRRFGKFFQIFTAFSQSTGTDTAVGTITTTYRDGAGGICSHLILLWATPLYWLTAPWYRRMRVLTLGDFFRERYQSRALAMFYSLLACFGMVIIIGLGLKATCATIRGVTLKPVSALSAAEQAEYARALRLETLSEENNQSSLDAEEAGELQALQLEKPRREFSYLNETWLAWAIVGIVFVYGVAGGFEAAVWTNAVHGVLILVLSVILIPFGIARLDTLNGGRGLLGAARVVHEQLPGRFFSIPGSAQNADFTWYFIVVLSVMATLNVAVQSNQLTANASARDEFTARVGFMTGNFMKRFCTILWGVVGLLAYALYSQEIQNSDLVWGHATRDLLGVAGFGLVGLMIACLLAAFHSTAGTLMISASSLFARNVYAPLVPGRSEAHYIGVGRLAGAGVLAAAALICIAYDTIVEMLKFFWEYNAIVAASFWCGLKWRRATRAGAWASILTAFTLFLVLPAGLPLVFPKMRTSAEFLATTKERVMTQTFTATARDVENRRREIENWTGPGRPPAPLHVGETAVRTFTLPPKAIYWAQGIREVGGVRRGEGMFHPELFLLGQFFDLTQNPNALNETIRYAYKIVLPFLVLIVVSLFTRPDDSREVQNLFVRMRVKVRPDAAEDRRAVQAAYADPDSTRSALLFPHSSFEFLKWDGEDAAGFLAGCGLALAVIGGLYAVLHFGG